MINRMVLKTVSLVNNYSANLNTGALKPKGANNDFLSIIRTSIKSIGKKADQKHNGLLQTVLQGKNRHHFYLEALRRGLLAKGGALNKISLKSQDLNILKEFLYKCGYSKKDVESCLKELAENSPRGEINFAAFFNKIEELDPQNNKTDRSVTLEFSAVPQLETILRDSGFTLKEI